jgi:flagellar biosynthesis chaperone FliJ
MTDHPISEEEEEALMPGENEIRSDLHHLLETIKDNRTDASKQLSDLDQKFDAIPTQFEALRKEQRESIDALRRELQSYFVAKAEFNPFQQFVMGKFTSYDQIITESRANTPVWVVMQEDIKLLKKWMEESKEKGWITWTRVFSVGAFLVSVLTALYYILPHLSFH